MSREIIFRAWDKCVNEMSNQFKKSVVCEDGTEYTFIGFNFHTRRIVTLADILADKNRFVLMQYTGMKDKNGKMIFGGDIANAISDKSVIISKGIIEFRFGIFGIWNGDKFPHTFLHLENLEVIGNIFEHPHLLEPKKESEG